MCIFVFVIFYRSHFVFKKFLLLYLFLKFISTVPLISTIFFLTSSPSFFSRRYVSYTRSKDETVRIWGTSEQVVIFIIIIIIILLVHLVLKIKCCREIITTNVIVFIFKYMLIFFFFLRKQIHVDLVWCIHFFNFQELYLYTFK